ncbi:uncharacterized protein LOC144563475 [Carex rostrata]
MDKAGIFPVQNNASNLAGVMISVVDTTTKRPIILRNNVYGNFIPSSFPSRKSFHDEASIDRKGKRKIVNEIDFFSSEKRKMPRLEPGPVSLSIPQIKEEDITLQIGLNNEEPLQQAYKRVAHELAVTKSELQREREEKSTLKEEFNRLNNMMAKYGDNYYYPIAVLHKGHQENPVLPSHTIKRMNFDKQQRENYQVLETNAKLPHI